MGMKASERKEGDPKERSRLKTTTIIENKSISLPLESWYDFFKLMNCTVC